MPLAIDIVVGRNGPVAPGIPGGAGRNAGELAWLPAFQTWVLTK